ncbi:uncharacterized protein [Ptychodera flava]|uniref:uncharacterized protein isoform X2 n=1 Tax=Ptychodera flava TaxID=63121 RepID=UPI003969E275
MQRYPQQNQPQIQVMQGYSSQHGNTSNDGTKKGFAHRSTAGLSICQIILGGTAVCLGIAAIVIGCQLAYIGTGIWCGIFFAITGIVGLVTASKKSSGMISTFMIMSISSAAIFATMLFVISVVAATREYRCYYCSSPKGRLAVDVLLAVVAVAEAAVAIVASAICCNAVCCNKPQQVFYGFSAQGQTLQTGAPMEESHVITNPYASSTNIQYNARQTNHAPLQLTASNYGAREGFAHRTTAGLSICQFILGLTAISLGIAAIAIKCELSHIGTGIWCGAFFVITGIIGLVSAAKKTTGAITAFMVLSIISACVFATCLFVISTVAATWERSCTFCPNPSMYGVSMHDQTAQHRVPTEQGHVIGNPYALSGNTQFDARQRVIQQQVYTIPSPTVPQNTWTSTSQQGTSPTVRQPQPMHFQQQSQQHPALQQQPAWRQRQRHTQSRMSPQQSQPSKQIETLPYQQQLQQPTQLQLQRPQSQPLSLHQSPPQQQPPQLQRTQPQQMQQPPSQPLQSQQSPPPQQLGHVDTTHAAPTRQQQHPPRGIAIVGGTSPSVSNVSASSPPPEYYVVDNMEAQLVENESHG